MMCNSTVSLLIDSLCRSSAIIFPSWLDTATSSSALGTCKDRSTEKVNSFCFTSLFPCSLVHNLLYPLASCLFLIVSQWTLQLSFSMTGTKESWTRCAAHVYISRVIRVLQLSEGKETQTLDASQLRPSQTLGGSHIMPDHSNVVRNRRNGTPSDSNMFTSADRNNSHEGANVIPVTHQHHQEQQEGPSFSGCCASKEVFFCLTILSVTLAVNCHLDLI